jgi:hypothetical protein
MRKLVGRSYVPITSLVLVVLFAHLIIGSEVFNPFLAGQNKRIRFQGGGESAAGRGMLTPADIALAENVLVKDRPTDPKQAQLMYIGNSQTIAIMDQNPGDLISPQWLQLLLAHEKQNAAPVQVNLASLPNLSMPELLIKIVAAGEARPRRNDIVVASIVLEEFRGLGVRDEVTKVAEQPEVEARTKELLRSNPDLASAAGALTTVIDPTTKQLASGKNGLASASYAARAEEHLQSLFKTFPVFSDREALQGLLYLTYYNCRNRALGITSASVRPIADSAYRASLQTIELMFGYAKSKNIKVVLYLAPIRPLQPNPNLPVDVARFRQDVPVLCKKYGTTCLDYVDLVPENLWTNYPDNASGTEGQRDYAHFTGAGHKLVAETLLRDVGNEISGYVQELRAAKL